ncbi:MAG: Type 1 glutamine amidotransferase-like domain-containing protein [Clostridia bacterium]|nr:Type 1 glutamine amidotransferase-like domain-containing protein [Clostridia bacterium]
MKLYLSSYRLGNDSQYLKDWISNNDNKILLIPNARDAKKNAEVEKNKIATHKKILEELGFEVRILDLKEYFKDNEKLKEDIENYNAFCAIGGNAFVLRQAMKLSGFDKYLIDNINNKNILYIGYSAGSCVVSKCLDGLQYVDEPINPYNNDEIIYEGINLVDYTIAPHYKSDNKESKLIDNVVDYLENNNINYRALRDGDVIRVNWDE